MKIRVLHFCNQLSLGGTEKTMEIFCRLLDSEKFEVFALTRPYTETFFQKMKVNLGALAGHKGAKAKKNLWRSRLARLHHFQSYLGEKNVRIAKNNEELRNEIAALKPDILHIHYSGNPEAPLIFADLMAKIPVIVTTNQFEIQDTSAGHRYVKKMYFVSQWILENKARWAAQDSRSAVMYNLTDLPYSEDNLREELKIPQDAFVIGRVGRADNGIHWPLNLKAFQKIANEKTYFLALNPPPLMIEEAQSLGLKNFHVLPPSTDPVFLSKFYNTIDVLAHARRDGETFGCNIAEAMIHSKPVVSHKTPFMNAQIEVIGDCGLVTEADDVTAYSEFLKELRGNKNLRLDLGKKAKKRAEELFESSKLARSLENDYLALIAKTGL